MFLNKVDARARRADEIFYIQILEATDRVVIRLLFFLALSSYIFAQQLPLLFQGQNKLSQRELYGALNLEEPYACEFYKNDPTVDNKTAELLTQVIQNYYRTKGFYHAKVTLLKREKSLLISIEENEPLLIKSINIESPLDITASIPFKINDAFDADAFTQSKKSIKLLYSKEHYCNISLFAKAYIDTKKNSANIIYKVRPNELCYFHNIEVNSSQHIDSEIAKSLLYFEKGELFSFESIKKSYTNIYAYDGVSRALLKTSIEDNKSVNVVLEIDENEKPIRFVAGLGLSSDEGLMGQLGVKHRNFYGNLKSLSLETRVTKVKQTLKTVFNMPLIHKNATGVEVGLENEIFSGFKEYRLYAATYLKQSYLPHSFKESIVLDRSSTYDSDDFTAFPEGVLLVVSPKLEWSYDTRDSLLDPRSGYFLSSDIMGSLQSPISDASYLKIKLGGAYLYTLQDATLGAKVNLGSLHIFDGEVPASYRFFAGGMHSNRAYTYRDLGPKNSKGDPSGFDSIVETTFEYRFKIYGNFRAVLFSDNTFVSNSYVPNREKGYYSGGIGFRYISPIGPIAFDVGADVGNPKKQYAFHFHIGELF